MVKEPPPIIKNPKFELLTQIGFNSEYPIADRLARNYVIYATKGNFTRFINHSDKPNLNPVYALHFLIAGEMEAELTDYIFL